MEGCDGDEWELYNRILDAIAIYERTKNTKHLFDSPVYTQYKEYINENIDF